MFFSSRLVKLGSIFVFCFFFVLSQRFILVLVISGLSWYHVNVGEIHS